MKVTIENFRCFGEKESPAERTFSESNVNLFSGVSGKGKTTTFHAVLWCMFGRTRGIKPIEQGQDDTPESEETSENKKMRRRTKACCPPKTRVTVELDGLVMMREKTPEVFQLEENSVILEGKIAQDRIYQLFGDEDFFIATSFLQQRGNHPLIYLPCAERFTLLYNLTFGYSPEERLTPDAYISAVSGEINSRTNDLKGLESVRDYILKAFHSQEEEAEKLEKKFEGLDTQKQLKDREMEYLETIENTARDIQVLEKKKLEHFLAKDRILALENDLDEAQERLDAANEVLEQTKQVDSRQIENITKDIMTQNKITEIENKLEKVSIESDLDGMSQEKLSELSRLCANVCHFMRPRSLKTKTLAIERAKEIIDSFKLASELEEQEEANKQKFRETCLQIERQNAELDLEILRVKSENEKKKLVKKNLEDYLANQEAIKAHETELEALEKMKTELKDSLVLAGIKNFVSGKELEKKINDLSRTLDCLECPECNVSLAMRDRKLVKVLTAEERETLTQTKTNLEKIHKRIVGYELKSLKWASSKPKEIAEPELFGLDKNNLDCDELPKSAKIELPLYQPLRDLSRVEKPKTSEVTAAKGFLEDAKAVILKEMGLEKLADFDRLLIDIGNIPIKRELETELAGLSRPGRSFEELVTERNRLVHEDKKYKEYSRRAQESRETLEKVQMQLSKIFLNDFDEKLLLEKVQEKRSTESLLGDLRTFIDFVKIREEYQDKESKIDAIREEIKVLTDLKKSAEFVSIESVNSRIICLEQTVNSLLGVLFEKKPIKVSIKAIKEPKTKKGSEKNQVNMTIFRDGHELKLLSGGESSRFNLALTMAMNSISGSNILLLDEVLDGIEEELKESTIELVKNHCAGKTVVFICHNSVKGMYDEVVMI